MHPPFDLPGSNRPTRSTIPSEKTPLGCGDWLTDKDVECWLNQELCHMEVDEPHVWTVALLYISRLSTYTKRVESGTRLANRRWRCHHIFMFNSDDKEGWHWFVCAFDCRVRLNCFTFWVREPLSSTHLIRSFLLPLKKLSLTTKQRALEFQKDGCVVVFKASISQRWCRSTRGTFSDVPLVPMGASFVDYVLSIFNADRVSHVLQARIDDVEGVTVLPGPPESPPEHPS